MKSAIITGGTGMVALALERMLTKNGVSVTLVIRPNSAKMSNMDINEHTRVIQCDIGDLLSLKNQINEKIDAFYHFAWDGTFGDSRNNLYLQNNNIKFTLDAVELASQLGCGVFVGAGSQAEYGRVDDIITSCTPTNPENGYGIAKLAACRMSRIACESKGIRQVWGRIISLYGQCDNAYTMMMSCIRSTLENKHMSFTKGKQVWDYLHCDDAAQGFYKMGLSGKHGAVYPLASGNPRTLAEYITAVRDTLNPELELGIGEMDYPKGQVMSLKVDISELCSDTGYLPEITFEEGVLRTAEWIRLKENENK